MQICPGPCDNECQGNLSKLKTEPTDKKIINGKCGPTSSNWPLCRQPKLIQLEVSPEDVFQNTIPQSPTNPAFHPITIPPSPSPPTPSFGSQFQIATTPGLSHFNVATTTATPGESIPFKTVKPSPSLSPFKIAMPPSAQNFEFSSQTPSIIANTFPQDVSIENIFQQKLPIPESSEPAQINNIPVSPINQPIFQRPQTETFIPKGQNPKTEPFIPTRQNSNAIIVNEKFPKLPSSNLPPFLHVQHVGGIPVQRIPNNFNTVSVLANQSPPSSPPKLSSSLSINPLHTSPVTPLNARQPSPVTQIPQVRLPAINLTPTLLPPTPIANSLPINFLPRKPKAKPVFTSTQRPSLDQDEFQPSPKFPFTNTKGCYIR